MQENDQRYFFLNGEGAKIDFFSVWGGAKIDFFFKFILLALSVLGLAGLN